MNLYFLVEGYTESEFYPRILEYCLEGKLTKVEQYNLATSNNYHLIGNGGYPYIYTGSKFESRSSSSLKNSILEINDNPVYDYLIVCLDADDCTVNERMEELQDYIEKYKKEGIVLNTYCELKIIVQNRCIETWFLGNKSIFKNNPTSEPLTSYVRYYNVKINDPEIMGHYSKEFTYQNFHHQYLRQLFKERRLNYRKGLVETVGSDKYIKALQKRVNEKPIHLRSLNDLFTFCEYVKSKLV